MKDEKLTTSATTGKTSHQMTGKVTPVGMEAHYLTPIRNVSRLLPAEMEPFSILGLGLISVGAWFHSDTFIDDVSFGPALEVWSAALVRHGGKTLAFTHTIFNSNPKYADAVCDIFKFTKLHAKIDWKEEQGWNEVEVSSDGQFAMRFSAKPMPIPATLPLSKPRACYVLKEGKPYLVSIDMQGGKVRWARTKLEFSDEGPLRDIGTAIRPVMKMSFFYQNFRLEVPVPAEI